MCSLNAIILKPACTDRSDWCEC